ncbi:tRNA(Ile)-lysidine synthase [Posidoniimonas polymericola]|uniref:tRNA(Ile)-lysidine synthase n=1 Tax=Posidoniimonas polymericola TaxID=2528002 RepID=A0A5C5YT85_9BACT|nr:tRNA lysidine(34) synthetase TilS [Posidoniimonas polymericola]TWT78026.1 tRNA(Ile)-lysidine synthase [Posidoniimonas polymericola]
MTPSLTEAVAQAWPPAEWRDVHLLAAVSGGADSVALLRALHKLKREAGGRGRLLVAHFDHGIRGVASADDARWVAELAEGLGLECRLGVAAGPPPASEQHARDARYRWLAETAGEVGARHIATGHTADDQTETILYRLLRGSGLAGLAGVPPHRPLTAACDVVRPLLEVTRAEVEQHLRALDQPYRTDATNAEPTYARNRMRNELLPALRLEFGEGVDAAIRRAGQQAGEAQQVVGELAARLAGEARIDGSPDEVRLSPALLAAAPPLVAREACKLAWRSAGWPEQSMGAEQWQRLYTLLCDAGTAGLQLPGGVDARWVDSIVVLRRTSAD